MEVQGLDPLDARQVSLFLRAADWVSEAIGKPANIIFWLVLLLLWTIIDGIRTVLDHTEHPVETQTALIEANTAQTEQVHELAQQIHAHVTGESALKYPIRPTGLSRCKRLAMRCCSPTATVPTAA